MFWFREPVKIEKLNLDLPLIACVTGCTVNFELQMRSHWDPVEIQLRDPSEVNSNDSNEIQSKLYRNSSETRSKFKWKSSEFRLFWNFMTLFVWFIGNLNSRFWIRDSEFKIPNSSFIHPASSSSFIQLHSPNFIQLSWTSTCRASNRMMNFDSYEALAAMDSTVQNVVNEEYVLLHRRTQQSSSSNYWRITPNLLCPS